MDIVTIDLETYYDKDFSLSKMTTEAYIRDPRFEVIGVAIKINDQEVDTYAGKGICGFLNSIDYSDKAILCHNTAFDGAVLSWLYGITPKLWLDTLSMSRPFHRTTVGGSLKALAQHYKLGAKGTEVINALGKRLEDFTEQELDSYMDYCANDVELTYKLFNKLKVGFPPSEIRVIDQTIRMYTEPKIVLDKEQLRQHLSSVKHSKQKLLDSLGELGGQEDIKSILMSNQKFAEVLTDLGVTPPTKISARTGKEAYAFAKTDKAMVELLDHPDPRVSALASARMGIKSTIEETRTEALLAVADRGKLPILLNYYGAHTGRFSGGDGLNLQNLPARKGKAIRQALSAPEGKVIMGCDLSQIEARMLAWVAGQDDLVDSFAKGRDVYCEFASEVYGREITASDKTERFVGKTCLAEGTLVLCHRGWLPIEDIDISDLVWDGEEWVEHSGVIPTGKKQTINLMGVQMTPDHLVLCGAEWKRADEVVRNGYLRCQLSERGEANLPSQAMQSESREPSNTYWQNVIVEGGSSIQKTDTTVSTPRNASHATQANRQIIGSNHSKMSCQTSTTESDYYQDYQRQYLDAITLRPRHTTTTVAEESEYTNLGGKTTLSFSSIYRTLKAGITQISRWIELIMVKGMNPTTYDLLLRKQIWGTEEPSTKCNKNLRTYDVTSAGPRHRYTVLSESGPIIVHNCILGLGYQCGAGKFREMLRQASVDIDEFEAQRIVHTYRNKYARIAGLWNRLGSSLNNMLHGGQVDIHPVQISQSGITLPNKLQIVYPALRAATRGYEYLSEQRAYRAFAKGEEIADNKWVNIYGGKMTENIIQALARIVITHHMTQVADQCKDNVQILFQVHDEIVMMVDEDKADTIMDKVVEIMSAPPAWAEGLPVACEAGYANNYGDVERG
jgi:DNA polymerase I-like protein with 3'-5' exonuclease and polymerase domains